jgi:hypothetical protein
MSFLAGFIFLSLCLHWLRFDLELLCRDDRTSECLFAMAGFDVDRFGGLAAGTWFSLSIDREDLKSEDWSFRAGTFSGGCRERPKERSSFRDWIP